MSLNSEKLERRISKKCFLLWRPRLDFYNVNNIWVIMKNWCKDWLIEPIRYHFLCGNDGSGSKFFDLGWVTHLWFGFGKFPLKIPKFTIFFLRIIKKYHQIGSKMGRPLIYCRSKVWVGSGQGSSLLCKLCFDCNTFYKVKIYLKHWQTFLLQVSFVCYFTNTM